MPFPGPPQWCDFVIIIDDFGFDFGRKGCAIGAICDFVTLYEA